MQGKLSVFEKRNGSLASGKMCQKASNDEKMDGSRPAASNQIR